MRSSSFQPVFIHNFSSTIYHSPSLFVDYKCTYQVPTVDEVIQGVPLEIDAVHHHRRHRSRRDDDNYRQLRIHAHLDRSIFKYVALCQYSLFVNIFSLSIDQQQFINVCFMLCISNVITVLFCSDESIVEFSRLLVASADGSTIECTVATIAVRRQ